MNNSMLYGLMGGVLLAASTPAGAAEFPYFGAAIGEADYRDAGDYFASGTRVDDNDTAWKLYAGYQYSANLGLEFFYADFGEIHARAPDYSANAEAEAFGVSAVGIAPIARQFDIYGKLGVFMWDAETRQRAGLVTSSEDDDGTDYLIGIGARYRISNQVAVGLEWERYNDVGDADTTGRSDLELLSAGVTFSFY